MARKNGLDEVGPEAGPSAPRAVGKRLRSSACSADLRLSLRSSARPADLRAVPPVPRIPPKQLLPVGLNSIGLEIFTLR